VASAISDSVGLPSRLRDQLLDRRARLESAMAGPRQAADLVRLLQEVDAALDRLDGPHFGVCAVCNGLVEEGDLLANPTASYCLCELSPERQRALERDLGLAWHVQAALLPPLGLTISGFETHYRYIPQGPVSGDYCDLVSAGDGADGFYFMMGDVSGKGVAASLLMAHLNASLRAFAHTGLPPQEVLDRANRLLAESSLASHYATLICGRACSSGEVEVASAGHCPPIVVRADGRINALNLAGLPLGLSVVPGTDPGYAVEKLLLRGGDRLLLYTDGLTEAANANDEEYGPRRLISLLARHHQEPPRKLLEHCLADLSSFLEQGSPSDDLTILALARL
jgi:phosphoserine phosphatase RsbU/P